MQKDHARQNAEWGVKGCKKESTKVGDRHVLNDDRECTRTGVVGEKEGIRNRKTSGITQEKRKCMLQTLSDRQAEQ